jgi:hypothetical protein
MRIGHPLTYVDGVSEDYVYDNGDGLVDYGGVHDSSVVEFVAEIFDESNSRHLDEDFKGYVLRQLARKLKVKLRKRKLTMKEFIKLDDSLLRDYEKAV